MAQRAERGFYSKFFQYVSLSMISMAGISLYILADTYFISQGMGTLGIASLNLLLPAFSLVNALGLMFGMGAATRYKIRLAEGRRKEADRVFSQAMFAASAVSALFVVLGLAFPKGISLLLGGDADTLPYMESYLSVIWGFAPLFMINNVLVAIVRNDNRPGLAMGCMLVGSLVNVVLDWVFIFPLGLGMFGAALATGIAPTVSIVILLSARLLKKNSYRLTNPFRKPKEYFGLVKLGFSSFVNEMANGIVVIAFNFIFLRLSGNVGVAAYGIITNIFWVVIALLNGVAQGTQPLLSAGYGAGDEKICKKTYHAGIIFGAVFAIFVYAVLAIFAEPVIGIFNSDHNAELAEIAKNGLYLYFSGLVPAAFVLLTATFFNSTERPGAAIALSLSRGLFVIIPAAFLLAELFGITGVWTAEPVTELITSAAAIGFLIVYNRTRKRKKIAPDFNASFEQKTVLTAVGLSSLPEAREIRENVFVKEQGKIGEFDEFDAAATHVLVRVGESPVATGRLYQDSEGWHIGRICVLKQYRMSGCGRDALVALEDAARDNGAREVRLLAEADAVGFYRKAGYLKDFSENGAMKNVVPMKKKLK